MMVRKWEDRIRGLGELWANLLGPQATRWISDLTSHTIGCLKTIVLRRHKCQTTVEGNSERRLGDGKEKLSIWESVQLSVRYSGQLNGQW